MYIFYIYIIYIYIYISGQKWFTTHRVLKSHRSKMGIIYIYNHENNVPSRLSPQWLCGSSCTWAHDVRLSCAQAVPHVPKCVSWHKAIMVITRRAHCFHDCIYITIILLLKDFSTLRVMDHLWPFLYIYNIHSNIYIHIYNTYILFI